MELCPVAPISCLDLVKEFKYHLVESHWLLEHPAYYSFYEELSKDPKKVLMLDNSEGIGHRVATDQLLELADELHVAELVSPDVNPIKSKDPAGALKTLALGKEFKDQVGTTKYKIVGAIQGRTIEEATKLLDFFKKDICAFPNRAYIPREFLMRYCEIPVERRHMFGASSVLELIRCKDLARSVDTNLPFRAANSRSFIFAYNDDDTHEKFRIDMEMQSKDKAEAYLKYVKRMIE